MAAASKYTEEEKAGFVALAQAKGRKVASKKAKVSPHTLSTWAKASGVKFTSGKKAAPKKRRSTGKATNGKANGHPPGSSPYLRGPQL